VKLDEIYNIEEEWDKIDQRFNRENFEFRNVEEDRYVEIAMKSKGETPVITKEPAQDKCFSTNPHHNKDEETQSPGFRGEQSAKIGAGVPAKKFNKWEDVLFPQPNSI